MSRGRIMRDRMIGRRGRDGRNPYGSRGGYVRDHRDYRDYRDYPEESMRREEYDYKDYGDYSNDDDYDYDLSQWKKKLQKKARTNYTDDEAINKAKSMGVRFEDYDEEEYLVVFYMLQSDFPNLPQLEHYLIMAKQWLEDDDTELSGSDKLCAYYYAIVKGKVF